MLAFFIPILWNMSYEHLKIQEYNHRDLYLHEEQYPYIGRCYARAKRSEADRCTDMNTEELLELFNTIIPAWNNAITKLYNHHRENIAILGNTAPHLHTHLIPRYIEPKELYNIRFVDPNPTGNYAPYPKQKIDETILQDIKSTIIQIL